MHSIHHLMGDTILKITQIDTKLRKPSYRETEKERETVY